MRERAGRTRAGLIPERSGEEPLATVGKPYKLPDWSAVCGDFLAPSRTLCGSRNRADSKWGWLRLFDSNRPTRHESAPSARKGPHL
jgi:hypothetical protein